MQTDGSFLLKTQVGNTLRYKEAISGLKLLLCYAAEKENVLACPPSENVADSLTVAPSTSSFL